MGVNPKIGVFTPNHPIFIGFSIIFKFSPSILGGQFPLFLVQHQQKHLDFREISLHLTSPLLQA